MLIPIGHYQQVRVIPVSGHQGQLANGTGTAQQGDIFSCGPFDLNDRPNFGDLYSITGRINDGQVTFLAQCVNVDETSIFYVLSTISTVID